MIISSLLVYNSLHAQKLYVYVQEVKTGATKIFTDASGKEYQSKNEDRIHLIYLQTRNIPTVKELWIDGNRFEFTVDSVSSPVVLSTGLKFKNHGTSDTLVRKTNEKVYRIIPGKKITSPHTKNSKGVTLVLKGRKLKVTRIKELPPVYNQ